MKHRTSIHIVLVTRLVLVAALVSVAVSAIVIVRARNDIGDLVIGHLLQAASDFSYAARDYLDQPGVSDREGLRHALDEFASRGVELSQGRTMYAVIIDKAGEELLSLEREYDHIDAVKSYVAEKGSLVFPENKAHAVVDIDGRLHVLAHAPLTNAQREEVATVYIVFAVSGEAMQDAQNRVVRSILIVIGIVLVTTLLLYPVIISLLRRQAKLSLSLLESNLETLKVLGSAVAKRDSDTDIHNYRVTIYSVGLAEELGLSREDIRVLIKGAFLHDVGKVGIKDSILLKPGKLTDEEYDVMKTHVSHGLDIVDRSSWLNDARDVVGYHHEKVDGTGYLSGLSGDSIPLGARIFAIADVFDALTSRRPYKEPFSLKEAMDVLEEGRGTHFDAALLDAFARIAPKLYDRFADRDGHEPRDEVDHIMDRYFSKEIKDLMV